MHRPLTWIRDLLRTKRPPILKRPKRTQLRVEVLEDRLAPALLTFLGQSNSWSDPANWTGNTVPTAVDEVMFTYNMMMPVTTLLLPGAAAVQKLTLNPNMTLTIDGSLSVANLQLGGGTINGIGTVYVGTTLNWTGGVMSGSGTTSILASATATVATTATSQPYALNETRVLHNLGTTNWNGPFAVAATALINNQKTLNFTATDITNYTTATRIQSTDTLVFNQSTITFNVPQTFTHHMRINNDSTKLVTVNGNVTFANLTLASDLTGPGNLTVNNTFAWLSGKQSGAGSTIVAATGTLDLASVLTRTLDGRTLTVHGLRVSAQGSAGNPPPGSPPPTGGGAILHAAIGITNPNGYSNPDTPFDNKNVRPVVSPGPTVFDANAVAGEIYTAMYGGTFSLETTEESVFKILESYDWVQLAQVETAYGARFLTPSTLPRSLRTDLATELSEIPEQVLRAQALMDGNRPLADAAAIRYAIYPGAYNFWQKDYVTLFRVLGRYVSGPLSTLHTRYADQYSVSLPNDLDARLSGAAETHALYLANYNVSDANRQRGLVYMEAVALNDALFSSSLSNRADAVAQIFARNASRMTVLLDVYSTVFTSPYPGQQNLTGWDLLSALMQSNGWTAAEKSYVGHAFGGNRIAILAAKLNDAMDRWGTDEDAVWNTLDGLYADERAMVAQVFQQNYAKTLLGAINGDFEDNAVFGNERSKTLKLYTHGGLTVAERFYYALSMEPARTTPPSKERLPN